MSVITSNASRVRDGDGAEALSAAPAVDMACALWSVLRQSGYGCGVTVEDCRSMVRQLFTNREGTSY